MSKMLEDALAHVNGMSPEEMKARAEALQMGQATIIETALAAMLLQLPHPDAVAGAIAGKLDDLKNTQWPDDVPDAVWAPQTIHAGAESAANRILYLYREVKRRASN